jgi:hypothetical protein
MCIMTGNVAIVGKTISDFCDKAIRDHISLCSEGFRANSQAGEQVTRFVQ